MAQTNIQVPIEQRNHDEEVLRKREILKGDKRFKDPGPSSLAQDDKLHPVVLHHNSVGGHSEIQLAVEAPDLLYGERMGGGDPLSGNAGCEVMGNRKQHMSGRRHAGSHLNQERNVGSEHLKMAAEPHGPLHKKEPPHELGAILPKDQ
jgi:hypothetical protein